MTIRRIEIVPYDPNWPEEFNKLASVIRDALGDFALRIDHIGSTSVPGLAAKDVIDMQVTVADLDVDTLGPALAHIGYTDLQFREDHVPPGGSDDPLDWRKLMPATPPGQRRTHLHIRQQGRPNQHYPLLFRDYLRSHPDAAAAYARVKIALARLHPDDIDAYYDVKDPVCDLIYQAAERWERSIQD
jgi:GrpB-like predicted nucleotidyltransferase (UPF0157 family)